MKSQLLVRNLSILMLAAILLGLVVACSTTPPEKSATPTAKETSTMQPIEDTTTETAAVAEEGATAHSAKERNLFPNVSESQLEELAAGNRAFTVDLYQSIRDSSDNLFFSPYSISLALAMTYGGARGETARQMAETLHFTLPDEVLHAGFNALDLELASRGEDVEFLGDYIGPGFKLHIANSIWAQYNREFQVAYLDLITANYEAGLHQTNFVEDPEGTHQAINDWVREETKGKIEDIIPQGSISTDTQLVLANAIYFSAPWENPLYLAPMTPFNLLDGSRVNVPMMKADASELDSFRYAAGEGFQAIELPFHQLPLSMVILMPDKGTFIEFEANLTADELAQILESLEHQYMNLKMPKFSFEADLGLSNILRQMGMVDAFNPQTADFSGMDSSKEILLSDVRHKAFIDVNEKGVEAAAATTILVVEVVARYMDEIIDVTIDKPFIFLVQDKPTGTILFMGRVLNPLQ